MNIHTRNRGGSRTCPKRVHQPLRWGYRPNIFYTFSEKVHEIKEILVRRRGGRTPGAPPLDPPLGKHQPLNSRQLVKQSVWCSQPD